MGHYVVLVVVQCIQINHNYLQMQFSQKYR